MCIKKCIAGLALTLLSVSVASGDLLSLDLTLSTEFTGTTFPLTFDPQGTLSTASLTARPGWLVINSVGTNDLIGSRHDDARAMQALSSDVYSEDFTIEVRVAASPDVASEHAGILIRNVILDKPNDPGIIQVDEP